MKTYNFDVVILKFITLGHNSSYLKLFVSYMLERAISSYFTALLSASYISSDFYYECNQNLYNAKSFRRFLLDHNMSAHL